MLARRGTPQDRASQSLCWNRDDIWTPSNQRKSIVELLRNMKFYSYQLGKHASGFGVKSYEDISRLVPPLLVLCLEL